MNHDMEGKAYLHFHSDSDMSRKMLKDMGFEVPEKETPIRIFISRIYGINNQCPQNGDTETPGVSVEISSIDTGVLNGRNIPEYIRTTPKNEIILKVYTKRLDSLDDLLKWFKTFQVDAFGVPDIDYSDLAGTCSIPVEPKE
jgi:hypothetical protein